MRSLRTIAILAAALALPLAGCDDPQTAVHNAPKLPRADRATALHGVSFPPTGGELSAAERQRLAAFVHDLPAERTIVTILTPDGSPLQAQRAAAVRGQLQAHGLRVASVSRAQGIAVGPDTVIVSAEAYTARALPCPDWTKSTGYDPLMLPHTNLGCATARNIADMVADPRDLEVGRTPGPAAGHMGAAAVDRLYNDKVKVPQSTTTGTGGN